MMMCRHMCFSSIRVQLYKSFFWIFGIVLDLSLGGFCGNFSGWFQGSVPGWPMFGIPAFLFGMLCHCYGVCFWLAQNNRTNCGIAMVSKEKMFSFHTDKFLFKWIALLFCISNGLVLGLLRCVGNLSLISKPAAIEFVICCETLGI